MKLRIIRLAILFISLILFIKVAHINLTFGTNTVRAFGDLNVDFHVPSNQPIFTITTMKPGDTQQKQIDVTDGGSVAHVVSVKGVKTAGNDLDSILDVVIRDGPTPVYGIGSPTGPKTLANFFSDSSNPNGIELDKITPGGHTTYYVDVDFPSDAGNQYQNKSLTFDLTFGTITSDHLVINEVYYLVDGSHGFDSPKDRGVLSQNGNRVTIVVKNNGNGSTNILTVSKAKACMILQKEQMQAITNINQNGNTGGNNSLGNTNNGTNIITGGIGQIINIFVGGQKNIATCSDLLGQSNEWVELYNPTDHSINIKNWSLTDNSGTPTVIHANKTIPAGGFAILAKDASTWKYWPQIPKSTIKIQLGSIIGDGLDNAGDHLILKNPSSTEVDQMSWGTDTTGFTPAATNPVTATSNSTERLVPGFDTNQASDWHNQNPPDPGQ